MSSTSHALPPVTPDVRARPRRGTLRSSQRSRGAAPTSSVSAEGRGEAALTIGQVAHTSGISDKLIRYYESIGLIQPAARSVSGYRLYTQRDVAVLRFIKRSRSLGFSLEMIARLVALWQDQNRLSAEVRAVALDHIAAVDRKIAELRAMADLLQHLMDDCRGDERSDCPILDHLADTPHTHRLWRCGGRSGAGLRPLACHDLYRYVSRKRPFSAVYGWVFSREEVSAAMKGR